MIKYPSFLKTAFLFAFAVAVTAQQSNAQTITRISPAATTRSGFLEIFGANFGTAGDVLIGGMTAPVSSWTNSRIVAYVPESAALAAVPVVVTTANGVSNAVTLVVKNRISEGRVQWRFRMDAPYSSVRPALAADGTIYVIDVYGRLYAVAPNGALLWVARNAGDKGVAVDSSGTIYTGSENDVKAFNPDGSLKWTFVQNPRAFIMLGLSVGPDGNIYGVATQGLGVFSLTPQGTLRWTNPESYNRQIVVYGEIVFGNNGGEPQLYFYANNHTRAVRLRDGASIFTIPPTGQPVISPFDQSMHASASAFSPDGQLRWTFTFPVSGTPVSVPDIGSDGTHYVVNRGFELYALNPTGTRKWNVNLPPYLGTPNVNPANTLLLIGSSNTLNYPGFIQAVGAAAGGALWQLRLPTEEKTVYNPWTGQYGFNHFIDTRTRFTPNSQTAYIITAIAPGGLVADRCFLYAISAGPLK